MCQFVEYTKGCSIRDMFDIMKYYIFLNNELNLTKVIFVKYTQGDNFLKYSKLIHEIYENKELSI